MPPLASEAPCAKRRGSGPGDVLLEDIVIREVEVVVAGTSGCVFSRGFRRGVQVPTAGPYLVWM